MRLQNSHETRARLMEAAVKRFSAAGYRESSVDEICSEAGVSKGAFYYHFPSKQALFLGLLQDWLANLEVAMGAIHASTIPETLVQLTDVLPAVLETAHDRWIMWLEFWLQATRDEEVRKATIAPYRHYRDVFAKLVEQGIAEGSLTAADPEATAQAILSMAVGLFLQGILDPGGTDWQTTAEQSMRILMNGLRKS
jgi:AcrR family transcriptional regulator